MNNNQTNNLNLLSGAFISADMGVELPALPAEGIAVKLMSAKGSKLQDHQLMLVGDGKYFTAQLTTPLGATCWAMIPVDYPHIKWDNNNAWCLLMPEPTTMSAEQFHAL